MADITTLNPTHQAYLKYLKDKLTKIGYIFDDWGTESVTPNIQRHIARDFSINSLKLRCRYDLLIHHPDLPFVCEMDAKTVEFRSDTGNIAIEVWPVVFSRNSEIPKLLVFKDAYDKSIWTDRIPISWLKSFHLPNRWSPMQQQEFINAAVKYLGFQPFIVYDNWERDKASGDPYFLWSISTISKHGAHFLISMEARAQGKEPGQMSLLTGGLNELPR